MYFKFKCPHCEKTLKVREELAGRKCACPYCKGSVRIPEQLASDEPDAGFPNINVNAGASAPGARPPAAKGPRPKASPQEDSGRQPHATGGTEASSDVPLLKSGLYGLIAAVVFLVLMFPLRSLTLAQYFWDRGPAPFVMVILTTWSFAILILKWVKLKRQRESMLLDVLPTELSKEITLDSLDKFEEHIHGLPGQAGESFLVNRAIRGLEHFRVRKNAAETVTMMESQSDIDANNVASSYTILKVFIWALPIMGFIGTVIGISSAVASLAGSLESASDINAVKESLGLVFGGLGVAFDTTLLALVLSLFVKIPQSALQKSEEDLVTWVDEYCNENLLKRLNDGGAGASQAAGTAGDVDEFRRAAAAAMTAQQEAWKNQMDEMGRLANEINTSLVSLGQQAKAIQGDVTQSIGDTGKVLQGHVAGIERGLNGLNNVLESLGEQQVVIQQVEPPRRGWFGRSRKGSE